METDGFLDGIGLTDAVDDDNGAGLLGHLGDTSEVLLKLGELATKHGGLLLVLGELATVGLGRRLELTHALDGRTDRLGVRQRAAEPTLGDVELLDRLGRVLDHLSRLLLRRDEEDLLAVEDRVTEERGGLVEHRDGLREIDDVDAVALVEDVTLHLRIPALGLVTEVQTGVKHVLEGNSRELGGWHFHFVFSFNLKYD